jgi:hypothetical protein
VRYRLGVSHEHWYHFADRLGSDTSRCPTRVAARSQLGLRPERNRRGHRRDLDRVSVDGSPVVRRVNCRRDSGKILPGYAGGSLAFVPRQESIAVAVRATRGHVVVIGLSSSLACPVADGRDRQQRERFRPTAIAVASSGMVWESHRLFLKSPRVTVRVNSGTILGYVRTRVRRQIDVRSHRSPTGSTC